MKCHSYPLSVLLLLIFCLPVSRSCLSNRKLTLYDTWSKYFLQIFYFVLAYSAFCHEESWFLSSWIYQCFLYGLCVILAHFFFFLSWPTFDGTKLFNSFSHSSSSVFYYFSPGLTTKYSRRLSSQVYIPGTIFFVSSSVAVDNFVRRF